jgi:phage terminase small subunit
MKSRHLNPKQERFVQEYCSSLNASDAARKAGYSLKSAHRFCLELLTKPHVQDAIQHEKNKLRKKMDISTMRVIQEYVSVGLSNIKNIIDQDPQTKDLTLKDLNEVPDHVLASIASLEQTEEGSGRSRKKKVKVTLWPKVPALESLCKALGYDAKSLEKELVAQESWQDAKMLDPRTFTKAQWEVFKEVNAKRLEELKP